MGRSKYAAGFDAPASPAQGKYQQLDTKTTMKVRQTIFIESSGDTPQRLDFALDEAQARDLLAQLLRIFPQQAQPITPCPCPCPHYPPPLIYNPTTDWKITTSDGTSSTTKQP